MNQMFQPNDCLTPEELKRYVSKVANRQERFKIENHLLDCPLCHDAVEGLEHVAQHEHKNLSNGLFFIPSLDLPSDQPEARPQAPIISIFRRIAAAAAIVLSIALGTYYFMNNADQRLAGKFYQPYENETIALRGADAPTISPTLKTKGIAAYENNDFTTAETLLLDFLNANPTDEQAAFFAGLAAFENQHNDKAYQLLSKVAATNHTYHRQAKWYQSLIMIKKGKRAHAKKLLLPLSETEGIYQTEALQLLKNL